MYLIPGAGKSHSPQESQDIAGSSQRRKNSAKSVSNRRGFFRGALFPVDNDSRTGNRVQEPSISTSSTSPPIQQATPLPAAGSPNGTRSLTRDDIIGLGNRGEPWGFLPVAAKALGIAPGDAGLVYLTAGNLASAGLRTLAAEVLGTLPASVADRPDAARLRSIIERLPADRLTPAERIGAASANLEVLRGSNPRAGSRASDEFAIWQAGVDGSEWFRAIDGNVVRRPAGSRGLGSCLSLSDQRAGAREFAGKAAPSTELMGRPIVVEGLSPPWVFDELMKASAGSFNGYRRRVVLVQREASEFLDGLSFTDLRGQLSQDRLDVYIGEDAARELAEDFARRFDTVLVGQYAPVLATRARVEPSIENVLWSLEAAQKQEHERLAAELDRAYAGRDGAWWRRRLGSGGPLKVLIPTCRFSTFIRHSSEDLARAFTQAGHRAQVLMEPDDRSSLSGVGYLRAVAEFEPDLIVLINYPRATMGANFPRNIPFVCWVQDAMPHLFDPRLGAAQGELDFMVGVRMPELVGRFGFTGRRCLPMPIVVSRSKFAAEPAIVPSVGSRRPRDAVRMTFATHHGETPEAMHERLMREGSKDPVLSRAMELLRPLAIGLGADILATGQKHLIRGGVVDAVRAAGGVEAPQRLVSVLTHAYVIPVADRVLRHTVAQWAARIARRRGWELRLAGKNWDRHPTLSEFAGPAIEHGDELRRSYRESTVHLHASYHGPFHQRVFECSLAGGLVLHRLTWPAISPLFAHAKRAVRARLGSRLGEAAARVHGPDAMLRVADHEELSAVAGLLASLELPGFGQWGMDDLCPVPLAEPPVGDVDPETWSLVEPLLACAFRDEGSLEAMVDRAVTDPAWRAERSGAIASHVRAGLTYESLAGRMVEFVRDRLAPGG